MNKGLHRGQETPGFICVNLWREMKLTEIHAPDFDLAMTLNSGQVFHWDKIDNGFAGTIGGGAVYVEQRGGC